MHIPVSTCPVSPQSSVTALAPVEAPAVSHIVFRGVTPLQRGPDRQIVRTLRQCNLDTGRLSGSAEASRLSLRHALKALQCAGEFLFLLDIFSEAGLLLSDDLFRCP